MKAIRFALGSFLFVAFLAHVSQAQVQRTFVSGLGSDGNPCSRSAPCRTFGQAISQTNAGGEVVVLDSAGYGPFSIAKSVSIIAPPGVYAGISVFSGDGIDINAGSSDTVILRGLTVNNQGSAGNGIVFNTGSKLHVEGCVINGFSSADGLSLLAGGGAQVEAIDSIMRGNSSGIRVQPSTSITEVTIVHVRLEANDFGLNARDGSQVTVTNSVAANNGAGFTALSATSASVQMNVESSVASGNMFDGIIAQTNSTGPVQVNVARCVISSNINTGIFSESFSTGIATVRVSSSIVTGNGAFGLINFGSPALLLSRGDNTVEGNSNNTSGTIGSYSGK